MMQRKEYIKPGRDRVFFLISFVEVLAVLKKMTALIKWNSDPSL